MSEYDVLEWRIQEATQDIANLRAHIEAMEAAAVASERAKLTWGISALGTTLMVFGAVIWSYRSVILGDR